MLFDPRERNVNPFLFPTRIPTMKKLVLTLAIHDKNVTMVKPAQVSFIIRTGPTPPSEDCGAAKTHRNDELGFTGLSKQRFVITVPTNTRVSSPVKVQVRGGSPPHPGLQWPAPLSRPESGTMPRTRTNKYTRSYQGPTTLCGTILSLPNLLLRQGNKKGSSLWRAPRNSHTSHPTVITLPGPGDTREPSGHEGQAAKAAHPERFPPPGRSSGPGPSKGLPTSHHAIFQAPAVEKQAPLQQDAQPQAEYSYSTPLFSLELQLHVIDINSCAPVHHLNSHAQTNYHAEKHHAQTYMNS